jgi:hypothetical protein
MRLDGVEQQLRLLHPGHRVHHDRVYAEQQRHDEAGHVAHVMVERQPGDDAVARRVEPERQVVVGDVAAQVLGAELDGLAEAGGAGGQLQDGELLRQQRAGELRRRCGGDLLDRRQDDGRRRVAEAEALAIGVAEQRRDAGPRDGVARALAPVEPALLPRRVLHHQRTQPGVQAGEPGQDQHRLGAEDEADHGAGREALPQHGGDGGGLRQQGGHRHAALPVHPLDEGEGRRSRRHGAARCRPRVAARASQADAPFSSFRSAVRRAASAFASIGRTAM